ncbi:MAG: nucleotidyltransferase family protein [Candidatus Latescibacteria bacterium]|nr:nucleotidyltransferase family protein [Candidatus Latescibacterota bacterium]
MGKVKQLLPFEGQTIIEHVVATLISSRVDETIVVLGHEAEQITRVLTPYPVKTVINPLYREGGMLSSLVRGIEETPVQADVICVVLGDQPFITREIIDTLIATYQSGGKGIVIPTCKGRRGHPVLLHLAVYREEITALSSDLGLKALMLRHSDDLFEVEVGDEAILTDLDYPKDYEAALRRRVS